ncbi:transducin beta-like protein 3 [Huso huso]|uniref:Transducin beta-like protein 3 n=1 Tax=Huso huso TaxID=61971 RepID=A0ABR0YU38_HUSHU
MASKTVLQFKTNYAVSSKIEPFYKGGKVQISKDGKYIFCTCGTKVNILDIATGRVSHRVEQDDQEDITSFTVSPDDEILVTSSRALLLKQWDWRENKCTRTWKAIHTAPVASMTFDPTSTLLATGGCDSTIKVWDVVKQYCTHNLKGSSGVVHVVEFHPDISRLQLFSSSMDCKIRIWDLKSSKCVSVLESHYSAVTSLSFAADGNTLVSSGRDKICIVWDLKTKTPTRTVPVFETVEAVVLLPKQGDFSKLGVKSEALHFITAGSKGVLRVWEASSARCVFTQTVPARPQPVEVGRGEEPDEHSLTHCLLLPATNRIATVTAEHNFLLSDLHTLVLEQQFVGYNDEVLDVKFLGPADSHIVVATNSSQLKVFDLATSNCQILHGHSETVLALDVFRTGSMFASCAKDKTIRVWQMNTETGVVCCVAQGSGHANAIGSISCSRMKQSFVVSGSQDCTIKVWDLPESLATRGGGPEVLHARVTEKGHDKDINSIAISPNDKLLATGSQDRTAKLWSSTDLSLLGVFKGHKRGIWCLQFSPMDQILASSSADGTVKLWGLQDFSCLKTFEGHDASVLKVIFVSRGTQLLTSGSDGLLKLWTIKTNECVKTVDAHEDKIWGLHGNKKDELVATGSADSCITLWKDVTEIELAEEQAKQEDQVMKQQELSNLLHEKKYFKAMGLAISLNQPHTVLMVIKGILTNDDGAEQLEKTILKLRRDQKESVMRFCGVWNTNARNCQEAQAVVQVLLQHESPEELLQYSGVRATLEGLIPYTERHFQRISRLLQASMFVDYMWENMRLTGNASCGENQDEEMESSSLGGPAPLFTIDPNPSKGLDSEGGDSARLEEAERRGRGEVEEEEESSQQEDGESDDDVSAANKGVKSRKMASPEEGKENIEPESSSEGDSDGEEQMEGMENEEQQLLRRETEARLVTMTAGNQAETQSVTPRTRSMRLRR